MPTKPKTPITDAKRLQVSKIATPKFAAPKADNTETIVQSLTRQIIEHRLSPGEKLKEQKLADQFGVSRTIVRQALNQLSQKHLIVMEPARGAFVAAPSVREAKEVFAVRAMLEKAMVRALVKGITPEQLAVLERHIEAEKAALQGADTSLRVDLLGDFHVVMAQLLGNNVLADALQDLISRCSLITLRYQTDYAATHSFEEHVQIVDAIKAKDSKLAGRLMDAHLLSVLDGMFLKDKS